MADISAVYMSIDVYSSSLDKLVTKTDQAVNKLLIVSSFINEAVSNMLQASAAAGAAANKINTAAIATDKATGKLEKASIATDGMINKMVDAGDSADNMTDKMLDASKSSGEAADKLLKAGESAGNMTDKMLDASKSSGEAADKLLKAGESADEFNKKLGDSDKSSGKAEKGVKKLISSLVSMDKIKDAAKSLFNLDNLKKATELIDDYALTNRKLSGVNDGNQTDKQLQDKIYASAGKSRGSYMEMAGTVSSLESTTGNVFGSNDETIAFAELSQKAMVGDGLSTEDRSSTMSSLTDSMASGSLGEDNLSSLEQSAPSIYNALSSYIGKSGDSLKALASQGGITADVLKNAMFAAGDNINANFENAPMTFSDIWTQIKDGGLQAFSGIMDKVTELISNPDFQNFLNGIIQGFSLIASVASWVIDTIIGGWSMIGPILGVIALVYLGSMILNLWAMIPPLIAQALTWMASAGVILLIIGIIALVIAAVASLGVSWEDIVGVIGGVIGGLVTFFGNCFTSLWNVVVEFINFFANVFNDPISSIKILFNGLLLDVLNIVEMLAKGVEDVINKIPGVKIDMTSGLTGYINNVKAETSKLKDESGYKEYIKTKKLIDIADGAATGKKLALDTGKKIANNIPDFSNPNKGLPGGTDQFPYDKYTGTDLGIPDTSTGNPVPVEGTGSNGAMNVAMEDEDLDYLRDIAERDYIANVATNSLAPNISIQFGDVHKNADVNKIAGHIRRILQDEIATASEGGY